MLLVRRDCRRLSLAPAAASALRPLSAQPRADIFDERCSEAEVCEARNMELSFAEESEAGDVFDRQANEQMLQEDYARVHDDAAPAPGYYPADGDDLLLDDSSSGGSSGALDGRARTAHEAARARAAAFIAPPRDVLGREMRLLHPDIGAATDPRHYYDRGGEGEGREAEAAAKAQRRRSLCASPCRRRAVRCSRYTGGRASRRRPAPPTGAPSPT